MQKTQPVADITVSTSKSCKICTVQNVTKDSTAFPVPKQLITNETETITRREILSKNREQPLYTDPIYGPFARAPENLQPNSSENKPDAKPKIDIQFEENSPHQVGIILEFYQRPDKSYFQEPK